MQNYNLKLNLDQAVRVRDSLNRELARVAAEMENCRGTGRYDELEHHYLETEALIAML